jgi:hypothetical protein
MIIFVFFNFFSILTISMATASILKKSTLKKDNFTWHMIFLQGFIKFDQGISEIWVGQTFDEERKNNNNNKNNNKKRSKHNMSPKLCSGAIIK